MNYAKSSLLAVLLGFLTLTATAATPLPERETGPKNAPIVLDVYSDLQCPACKEFYLRSLRRVMDEYCAQGKVRVVHHEFPRHQFSRPATEWAIASSIVGKYEQVCEALFQKQEEWGVTGKVEPVVEAALTPAEFKKVKAAMTSRNAEIKAAVDSDFALCTSLKVNGTPSITVTNKGKIVAPLTPVNFQYTILKRFLDDQLLK